MCFFGTKKDLNFATFNGDKNHLSKFDDLKIGGADGVGGGELGR